MVLTLGGVRRAREEEHNRFNAYNEGPLFILVRQSKYQYWMNVEKFEFMHDSWEQFMDELDEPVHMSKLPKEVWRSLGNVASKSDNEMIARAGKVLQSRLLIKVDLITDKRIHNLE